MCCLSCMLAIENSGLTVDAQAQQSLLCLHIQQDSKMPAQLTYKLSFHKGLNKQV